MLHIVLFEPEIPQNTGNIMRTCVAFGMKLHLIEPLGFSLDEKSVRRSGMDYIRELDMSVYRDWEDFVAKNEGEFYFITRYGKKSPDQERFDASNEIYLVFGKESTGIPKAILRDHLDRCLRLPMVPEARSLNLSNTVAILAYEVLRQNDYPGLSRREVIKGEDWLVRDA
ncbi:MAG: RNA methyltransferase [Firmicutes bacterium GWF2_51_9]|nr:MAG: RNA methyltransferase [Firmicutes bacterium GWF2_51_9]OGS58884.1 MAG: RNA methyltransferase [Firmicutes bacterium GWE2_51_13]HAM63515.1 RNA methyltransferase [Erysipelotrichaceae bacterium]HBZ42182.1 RNA methyltransferase [Erysipelotrichaceae bacterium]